MKILLCKKAMYATILIEIIGIVLFSWWLVLQVHIMTTNDVAIMLISKLLEPYLQINVGDIYQKIIEIPSKVELVRSGMSIIFFQGVAGISFYLYNKKQAVIPGVIMFSALVTLLIGQVIRTPILLNESIGNIFLIKTIIVFALTAAQIALFSYIVVTEYKEAKIVVPMLIERQTVQKLVKISTSIFLIFGLSTLLIIVVSYFIGQQEIVNLTLVPSFSLSDKIPDVIEFALPNRLAYIVRITGVGIPATINIAPLIKNISFIQWDSAIFNTYINQWLLTQLNQIVYPIIRLYGIGTVLMVLAYVSQKVTAYHNNKHRGQLLFMLGIYLFSFFWSLGSVPIIYCFAVIIGLFATAFCILEHWSELVATKAEVVKISTPKAASKK
ncbi:MAG: hypothetical protein ACRC6X_06935 [Culicoidibacterales bacterium]